MPTRPLVTSYAQDLRRFPDRWQQAGLVLLTVVMIGWPFLVERVNSSSSLRWKNRVL